MLTPARFGDHHPRRIARPTRQSSTRPSTWTARTRRSRPPDERVRRRSTTERPEPATSRRTQATGSRSKVRTQRVPYVGCGRSRQGIRSLRLARRPPLLVIRCGTRGASGNDAAFVITPFLIFNDFTYDRSTVKWRIAPAMSTPVTENDWWSATKTRTARCGRRSSRRSLPGWQPTLTGTLYLTIIPGSTVGNAESMEFNVTARRHCPEQLVLRVATDSGASGRDQSLGM